MPKKTLNTDIVNDYLDHIKKDKEKNLSIQTLKTYENIGNNLPFNILTNQNTIIKKLKDVYENPNLWWNEKKTQDLKDAWLSRNFGKPEILLNYLLDLAKSQNVI